MKLYLGDHKGWRFNRLTVRIPYPYISLLPLVLRVWRLEVRALYFNAYGWRPRAFWRLGGFGDDIFQMQWLFLVATWIKYRKPVAPGYPDYWDERECRRLQEAGVTPDTDLVWESQFPNYPMNRPAHKDKAVVRGLTPVYTTRIKQTPRKYA